MAPACMTDTKLADRLDAAIFDLCDRPNSLVIKSVFLVVRRPKEIALLFEIWQRYHSADDTNIHAEERAAETGLYLEVRQLVTHEHLAQKLTAAARANTLQLYTSGGSSLTASLCTMLLKNDMAALISSQAGGEM